MLLMLLVWPLFILVCKKVKKILLDQRMAQTKSKTHKQEASDISFNEPNNKVFFNGPTFDKLLKTTTPTTAKRNTNTQ